MKNVFIAICLFIAMAFMPTKSFSQEIAKPELLIVKFHADWCGSCKAIGPALEDLANKLDGKATLFVELNFTNNTTKHQSNMLASALGIEKIVSSNSGTGFVLVIDSKTKEVKAKFTKLQTTKEMGKKITSLL
jgi:thiol-disulfide isomerase/thioredoxin